jgi:hypothetical protein
VPQAPIQEKLTGSFWFLLAFDVCEEIRLDSVLQLARDRTARRETGLPRPTPDYVRFEHPPVIEAIESVTLPDGERLRGELKLYDYGVVSVRWELPFRLTWPELVERSSHLLEAPEPKEHAVRIVRAYLERISAAIVNARPNWLDEEYYAVQVDSPALTAGMLLESHGADIARIVRGETWDLSGLERDEVLRARMSYYPNDLLVVGWAGSFLYDNAAGAAADLQLLEYANAQLLEFRYYDQVLTGVLRGVYSYLARKQGLLARWRMAHEARRLNTMLLDVRELTERADTAIKFLSDMYSARLYRLAAEKIGVGDYRRLVDGKLETAGELYRFMMDQFHESRAFALELMIVLILIVDLVFLFRDRI